MSRATIRLFLQPFGHVAADDALGQPLDDGGLADAGLADEHRVVLGAAREHLDDAADLLVAADDRVELALARQLGQVAAVALERLVLALRVLVGHPLRCRGPPSSASRTRSRVTPRCCSSCPASSRGRLRREREQQVLGADVLVLQPRRPRPARRRVTGGQPRRETGLRAAVDLRPARRARRARPRRSRPGRRSSCAAPRARCRRAARPARPAGARARSAHGSAARRAPCAASSASWAFSVNLLRFMVALQLRSASSVQRRLVSAVNARPANARRSTLDASSSFANAS